MPYACPDCGAPVGEGAAVCPQCGFPIRRDAIPAHGGGPGRPGAPHSSGNPAKVLLIALVVGGFLMVMFIAMLAAIAIPRFSQVATRAKEMEGESLLQRVHGLEQIYRAENGRYTSDLSELRMVGMATSTARFYDVRVSAADDRELCLEAVPRPTAGRVRALSMDAEGRLYRDAGCPDEPDDSPPAPDPADEKARELLKQAYHEIAAYRGAHGGEVPVTLQELGPELEAASTRANYRFTYLPSYGGWMCLTAQPRSTGEGPELSVDHNGDVYSGLSCTGGVIDNVLRARGASPERAQTDIR